MSPVEFSSNDLKILAKKIQNFNLEANIVFILVKNFILSSNHIWLIMVKILNLFKYVYRFAPLLCFCDFNLCFHFKSINSIRLLIIRDTQSNSNAKKA